MKKIILFCSILFLTHSLWAQLPDCNGADSNVVFLHSSPDIYRWDPTLPISPTNPSLFLSNPNTPWGGLTVSVNLNAASPSPTFYSTDAGVYHYWDGVNWVNTGHTAATVNLGGGPTTIYGKNGGTGYISKYTGTGNDVFFANGNAGSGPYDLVTDAAGNLYEVDITTALGKIYKYDPVTAMVVDTFYLLGVTPQTAGPGFAMIGNNVYLGVNTTPGVFAGTIINDTAYCAGVGSFGFGYGDFASCFSTPVTTTAASLYYTTCDGPTFISIASPLLTGTPTFLWNFGDPASGINNTSTLGNTTHVFSGQGTFNVTLIISNAGQFDTILNTVVINTIRYDSSYVSICSPASYQGHTTSGIYIDSLLTPTGCDSIHSLFLTVNEPKTTVINQTVCFGQTYLGYGATGTYTDMFLTSAGCDSTRILNLTVRDKIETFLTANICENEFFEEYSQTGNYTDVFTSQSTGCDSTRYINLTVHPAPQVEIQFNDTVICKNDVLSLTGVGANSFNWYLNSSINPVSKTSNYNLQVKEHEFILLEGFSTFGCRDVETATFNYVPCCGHVFIPNVFTPNNDQLNDFFRIRFDQDLESYDLKIFDRWGLELYRSSNVTEGWNGKFKGKECEAGTYFYVIQLKCKEAQMLKGDFMLLR